MADISQIKLPNGDTFDIVDNKSGFITNAAIPALLSGSTATITPTQVKDALANNQNVEISHTDITFGSYKIYDFVLSSTQNILGASVLAQYNNDWYVFELLGNATNNTWSTLSTKLAIASDLSKYVIERQEYDDGYYIIHNDEQGINIGFDTSGYFNGLEISDSFVDIVSDDIKFFGTHFGAGDNLWIPTNNTDFTTKAYVDNAIPNVPSWALQSTKPTYTAAEVGALPNTTTIPSKTSDLTNDSNFISTERDPVFTAHPAYYVTYNRLSAWDNKLDSSIITDEDSFSISLSGNGTTTMGLYTTFTYGNYATNPLTIICNTTANTFETKIYGIPTPTQNDMAVNKKYVDDSISSFISIETDPIFIASAAYGITNTDISNWNSKTSNTGTVTSVAASGSGGITVSGSPITSSGTITVGLDLSTAINGLSEGTSPAQLNDYIVAQYAGGGTTTTTYHRRKLSNVIVGKAVSDQNGLRIDTGYLKLTGGNVTGPTTFGDSVSIDDLNAGQLVVNGSASITNELRVNKITTTNAIAYQGSQATYDMIKWKDNTSDVYGNGIIIGGGGLVIIGGGESADAVAATYASGGSEELSLTSDGIIKIWTNVQNGAASAHIETIDVNGVYSGAATSLASIFTVGSGASSHATAIQNWFNANKASITRNVGIANYSSASGNGSIYMGYFLSGYDTNPYGGFFVCHYNTPYYIGISNGTYTQQTILTSTNYTSFFTNAANTSF